MPKIYLDLLFEILVNPGDHGNLRSQSLVVMKILDVRIDNYSKQQALEKVSEFLSSESGQFEIFTPNPEMLVDAQKDEYFKNVLNGSSLNLCDGFGLKLASILSLRTKRSEVKQSHGKKEIARNDRLERIPGTDFMLDICKLAEEKGQTIYLLGSGSKRVAEKTAEKLKEKFPKLKIIGTHPGPKIEVKDTALVCDQEENDQAIYDIIMSGPDILFVAFGHNKQEKWIHETLPDLPSLKVAMGVGGAFDFISGKIKRAPKIFRRSGLEWVYRLVREPKRLGRIWKATVVFLYKCFIHKNK